MSYSRKMCNFAVSDTLNRYSNDRGKKKICKEDSIRNDELCRR